ncbi:Uncharacterised protein at_DN0052 [Pycnogonum litorale]
MVKVSSIVLKTSILVLLRFNRTACARIFLYLDIPPTVTTNLQSSFHESIGRTSFLQFIDANNYGLVLLGFRSYTTFKNENCYETICVGDSYVNVVVAITCIR